MLVSTKRVRMLRSAMKPVALAAATRLQPYYVCVAIRGIAISTRNVSRRRRCCHLNKCITLAVGIGATDHSYMPHSAKHLAPLHDLFNELGERQINVDR
jgi:hypothetical protein